MQLREIIQELSLLSNQISEEALDTIISVIQAHECVFVHGAGRTGLMLKAFAIRLVQMEREVYVVGETITPSIKKGDLLLTASASGRTPSVLQMAEQAAACGADVMTIVGDPESPLADAYPPVMVLESGSKFQQKANSRQTMGSLFEQMLLLVLDAVVLRMLDEEDMEESMAERHANLE